MCTLTYTKPQQKMCACITVNGFETPQLQRNWFKKLIFHINLNFIQLKFNKAKSQNETDWKMKAFVFYRFREKIIIMLKNSSIWPFFFIEELLVSVSMKTEGRNVLIYCKLFTNHYQDCRKRGVKFSENKYTWIITFQMLFSGVFGC